MNKSLFLLNDSRLLCNYQIYDWEPKPYKNATKDLPKNAPKQLKEAAKAWEEEYPERAGHMVWMSCEGENPADVENIGKITYYPRMGIPTYYFPYKNQKGYKSPIIFAHLENPKSKKSIHQNIEIIPKIILN